MQRRLAGFGVDHEYDLGRVPTVLPDIAKDFAQRAINFRIRLGVGSVEDERIDARIGQQLSVTPQDPRIGALIIAIEWFAPVMARADSAPKR